MLSKTNILLISFLLIISSSPLWAQKDLDQEENSFFDRVYVGGNFSLQFGNITAVDVSPLVGYMIDNNWSTGLGISYQYLRYNDFDITSNLYGGRLFVRRNLFDNLFAYAEYENLNVEIFNPFDGSLNREWVPGLFVGGGFFQPIGPRAGLNFVILYNLNHDELRSPYTSPIVVRAGITL